MNKYHNKNNLCNYRYKNNGKYIILSKYDKLKRVNYMKNNNIVKNNKPHGLWFSINNEWINYICDNEMKQYINNYNYLIKIKIKKDNKILIITKDNFKYKKNGGINWKYLFNNYDGIILNSDLIKNDTSDIYYLFYGWDVKSGVIWRNVNKYVTYEKIIPLN